LGQFDSVITARIDVDLSSVRERGSVITAAIVRAMYLDLLKLQRHIVADKLSGQVLNRGPNRPGHSGGELARSIRIVEPTLAGDNVVGQVLGAGGTAWYGVVHEYGGTRSYDIYPVNAKALLFQINGENIFRKHVLHPPLPERSFMRSALADMSEQIVADLQEAASKAAA
jgi:hypothetical protein